MKNLMVRFVREEEGQDLVEYALLLGLIAVVCILAVTALGTAINDRMENVTTELNAAS
ncbi:MAG: Flp family type IVb pilin [Acidobacteria bacterium]|nr:Flp family type IVb pilin [Acidobacteriota bacterium]